MEETEFVSTSNIDIKAIWEQIKEEIVKNIPMLSFEVWINDPKYAA